MKGDKRPVPAPPSASRNPELEPRTCYDSQSPSPRGPALATPAAALHGPELSCPRELELQGHEHWMGQREL